MRFTQNRRAHQVLFKLDKSFFALLLQTNLLFRFKHWKYGWPFSPLADTNRDRAAIRPVSCCTSFTVAGLLIARMAAHLSGFAMIPISDKRKPRKFPASTPKIHFSGFSFSLYLAIVVNNSSRSVTLPALFQGCYDHVVNVRLHIPSEHWGEYLVH